MFSKENPRACGCTFVRSFVRGQRRYGPGNADLQWVSGRNAVAALAQHRRLRPGLSQDRLFALDLSKLGFDLTSVIASMTILPTLGR
jgi:hypothetical protein